MEQRTVAPAGQPTPPDGQVPGGAGRMKGWLPLTLGLLAVVLGALVTVQGLGYVAGSVLTDQRLWAMLGPLLVLVGAVALWAGMRARRPRP